MFNAILTVFLTLSTFAVGAFLIGCVVWLFIDRSGCKLIEFWKEF